jgi:hypothetical protein
MNPVIHEKDVRDLKTTGKYQARLKARVDTLEDYCRSPWYKKGFKRART